MEKEELTIEPRIRAIEDRLEIYNLIAGHPPSADTGNAPYAEAVFTADAVISPDWGSTGLLRKQCVFAVDPGLCKLICQSRARS